LLRCKKTYRKNLGVDYVGLHLPKNASVVAPIEAIKHAVASAPVPVVLAGGVDLARLRSIPIAAIVVGSAIIAAPDPADAARRMAEVLKEW
jgi:3-keto-L-gulonate-6-phosphate decarboxylase